MRLAFDEKGMITDAGKQQVDEMWIKASEHVESLQSSRTPCDVAGHVPKGALKSFRSLSKNVAGSTVVRRKSEFPRLITMHPNGVSISHAQGRR